MKRFWKQATASQSPGGWAILLDGRPVRTPLAAPLMLPCAALAALVAAEWQESGETVDPAAMPMTGLANAAIDHVAPAPAHFVSELLGYGDTDTLLYRAEPGEALALRQEEIWEPLVRWAEVRFDVALKRVAGIMPQPQRVTARERFRAALEAQSPFALAAMVLAAQLSGSLVAVLALIEGERDAEALWPVVNLEEEWQAGLWGEDAEAAAARAARRSQFLAAGTFLAAAG